jgi:copper chaperone
MFEFRLPDMSCGHCVSVVTTTVKQVDPQAKVEVDLPSHTVWVDSTEDRQSLAEALAEAGYPAA